VYICRPILEEVGAAEKELVDLLRRMLAADTVRLHSIFTRRLQGGCIGANTRAYLLSTCCH